MERSVIQGLIKALRRFRDRIAYHAPVYDREFSDLAADCFMGTTSKSLRRRERCSVACLSG